jgi:hypothetical protein
MLAGEVEPSNSLAFGARDRRVLFGLVTGVTAEEDAVA